RRSKATKAEVYAGTCSCTIALASNPIVQLPRRPLMRVTEPRHYATDALLRDGGSIHIRAIRPDDMQRLLDLFERLSSRSVYFRFFQTKQRLTDAELRYFTELDFTRDVALVATLRVGQEEVVCLCAAGNSSCPKSGTMPLLPSV